MLSDPLPAADYEDALEYDQCCREHEHTAFGYARVVLMRSPPLWLVRQEHTTEEASTYGYRLDREGYGMRRFCCPTEHATLVDLFQRHPANAWLPFANRRRSR